MTSSRAKKPKATAKSTRTLNSARSPDESEERAFARTALRPTVQAAIAQYDVLQKHFAGVELNELVNELARQAKGAEKGDLGRMEAMLVAQAHTLDLLFNRLVQRGAAQIVEYPQALETYLKLAFRAQGHCRATIEALAEIKNPRPVAFVQQANIANGPQQVNNGQYAGVSLPVRARDARAGEIESQPSKLLEQGNGKWLDTRAQGSPVGSDPSLEAVEALDRPEKR